MEPLAPAYISALAAQLASLSAFLGGFAATFLATLLTLGHAGRLMTITIGFAVASSVSFIVTVVAATMLTAVLHPEAPHFMADAVASAPRAIGWITTIAALVGATFIIGMTVQVG